MRKHPMIPVSNPRTEGGSFIIEALVSVLIFSMGLIALMGMAAQAINQVGQSKYRNDASYLAGELIGDMWASSPTLSDYAIAADFPYTSCPTSNAGAASSAWLGRAKAALPSGCATVTITGAQADIEVSWAAKEDPNVRHRYITSTLIAKNTP